MPTLATHTTATVVATVPSKVPSSYVIAATSGLAPSGVASDRGEATSTIIPAE
jgi:hypothetical protein